MLCYAIHDSKHTHIEREREIESEREVVCVRARACVCVCVKGREGGVCVFEYIVSKHSRSE